MCGFSIILILKGIVTFYLFFFFFCILPYLNLPILFKDHNGNKATSMLFLCYPSHKLILDIEVLLLFLRIRFYFYVIS